MQFQNAKARLSALQPKTISAVVLLSMASTFTGCKVVEDTTVVFSPAAGVFTQAQELVITLPQTARNVYLTTDTLDPVPDPACAYAGENLPLDRATTVKLRFDVQGKTYYHEKLYVIEENPQDNNFTNRAVIEAWENFFVKQVLNHFAAPGDQDSVQMLEDGDGGTVKLETRILDRSWFFDVPTEGAQTYSFKFFEKTDEDTGEIVMLQAGAIYGYRNENGGYYSSQRGNGQRLKYTGTYTGWADGDFTLNADGNTSGGRYQIFCTDNGCAPTPVTYALGSTNQLIEVSPAHHDNTRSCVHP